MDNSIVELRPNKAVYFESGRGFYYSTFLEETQTKFENNTRLEILNDCYAQYFRRIPKYNRRLYFVFPYLPVFSLDIINDFNSKFKNIQYDVLQNRKMYLVCNQNNTILCYKRKTSFEVACPLLTINYNDAYDVNAVYLLNYILPIYLRIISYQERFIKLKDQPNITNLLSWVLGVNNNNKGYRSLSEKNLTEEQFLKIDNIELVNSNILKLSPEAYRIIRQTDIIEYMTI